MLTVERAERLAGLALAGITREYPNKIAHVLYGQGDARTPRELTPAFYGCFDWHSAVHGHWTLARLARRFPDAAFTGEARAALDQNLTPQAIAAEAAYLRDRPGFERPYGLAWLMALDQELRLAHNPVLTPLVEIAVAHVSAWLPKLRYPDRSGQHANTAFAMGLMLDWAGAAGHARFEALLAGRALDFFEKDRDAPVRWEPSGEDFLSPSLCEADLMRRVMEREEFRWWLGSFLPNVNMLQPVECADPTDGKLAHADGLNLSRAWMLRSIGFGAMAEEHAEAGLGAVTGGAVLKNYEGGHWLGTFAAMLMTT